ncbi:MAG TPA: glycosyltransferase [bacterium]|nr:glycosyltransferase [bacterium]
MGDEKLRVLIVIGSLTRGGGAERVAATLGNQLSVRGHEVHSLTFYRAENAHPVEGVEHCFDERMVRSTLDAGWKMVQRAWKIRKLCRKHRIDLTVSFMEEANFCALFAKIFFFQRNPAIVSVRNNFRYSGRLYRFLIRLLYPRADRVVAVSRQIEEMLKDDFGLRNTTTIYNPIDSDIAARVAQPLEERYRWIGERSTVFVAVGRQVRQKGHWHLIRAFQRVAAKRPDATLILLGSGELGAKLDGLIEACGLSEKVFRIGLQKNVFPFLRASHCFVMSSLWEGLPNAMIEALATGLPVLAADCSTGPREVLAPDLALNQAVPYPHRSGCGTLLPPLSGEERFLPIESLPLSQEEEALAEAMIAFEAPPQKQPRSECLERFGMDGIMERWLSLF